jgi:hypothetical protein
MGTSADCFLVIGIFTGLWGYSRWLWLTTYKAQSESSDHDPDTGVLLYHEEPNDNLPPLIELESDELIASGQR